MRNKVPDLRNKIGAVMGIFTLLGSLAVAQVNFLPEVNAAPTCENMSVAGVKAIGYEGTNVPKNVIDNKITTRWSNEGAGSWITLDLGEKKNSLQGRHCMVQGVNESERLCNRCFN
jgi:hypothetical protein